MAGVTGVVMTLSLILMVSSATELIRFVIYLINLFVLNTSWQFCVNQRIFVHYSPVKVLNNCKMNTLSN